MALEREPLATTIKRGDRTVRFRATAGEENGPYQWDRFTLVRGADRYPGVGMTVAGKELAVRFPVQPKAYDQVELPA